MNIVSKVTRLVILAIFASSFIFTAGLAHAVTPPSDVDYGLATDEQQGGGGLVGETVRV